jgi:hypothetical protein
MSGLSLQMKQTQHAVSKVAVAYILWHLGSKDERMSYAYVL